MQADHVIAGRWSAVSGDSACLLGSKLLLMLLLSGLWWGHNVVHAAGTRIVVAVVATVHAGHQVVVY